MLLAVQAANVFTKTHGLAYAQISPDLTFQLVSDNFNNLLRRTTAVTNQQLTDIFWEFAGIEPVLDDLLQGKLPHYRIEHFNYDHPDGDIIFLDIQISPLDHQHPQQGLILMLEDVSHIGHLRQAIVQERNELRLMQHRLAVANEELQRLNRQKSVFLSVAAHDLRGPLSVIHGLTSLLQMEGPNRPLPQKTDYLKTIMMQSDRLNQMINDLLDLDRLEQGTLSITLRQMVLNKLVEEVVEAIAYGQKNRNTTIEVNLPDDPLVIQADAERLWRVIYNLVHNAIKYSDKNGHVIIEAEQINAQEVQISVQDNGIGMTSEEISNLFGLYYRTGDAQKRGIKGTGLGLFIVKSIVEAHGGRVEVTSLPQEGSTFTIYLPVRWEKRERQLQEAR